MQNEFDKNKENDAITAVKTAQADDEEKNQEENIENKSEENIEGKTKAKGHIGRNPNMSSPFAEKLYAKSPADEAPLKKDKESEEGGQENKEIEEIAEIQNAPEAKETVKTEEPQEIQEIKADLADAIRENDIREIFDYFDIGVFMYRDDTCGLSEYRQPSNVITYEDIGISEEKLLENVVKISGNADFRRSSLKDFGKIKYIGGCADFRDSNFTLNMKMPEINAKIIFYENQTLLQGIVIKIITLIRRLFK